MYDAHLRLDYNSISKPWLFSHVLGKASLLSEPMWLGLCLARQVMHLRDWLCACIPVIPRIRGVCFPVFPPRGECRKLAISSSNAPRPLKQRVLVHLPKFAYFILLFPIANWPPKIFSCVQKENSRLTLWKLWDQTLRSDITTVDNGAKDKAFSKKTAEPSRRTSCL